MGKDNEKQKATTPEYKENYDKLPRCRCGSMTWTTRGHGWFPCWTHLKLSRSEYENLQKGES